LIIRDYHNERANIRRQKLIDRLPIHALFDYLTISNEFDIYYRIKRNVEDSLIYFYISHRQHNELFIENSQIFIIDSIYKTNRYKMFLVNIVDITSVNKLFYIESVFVKFEIVENFL
jgi:hypothetical protein